MNSVFWLDLLFFCWVGYTALITIVLVVMWWKIKDYGRVHYIAKDKPGVVYAVKDGETEFVRYIGITTNLSRRIAEHKRRASFTNPFYKWYGTALHSNLPPLFEVIEECQNRKELVDAEKKWIARYKDTGLLLNSTNGG